MDLKECLRKGLIRRTRADNELISSLLEMAEIKESTVKTAKIATALKGESARSSAAALAVLASRSNISRQFE